MTTVWVTWSGYNAQDRESPCERLDGTKLDLDRDARFVIGCYRQTELSQACDSLDVSRTKAAQALHPTGSTSRSYYFTDIDTWRVFRAESATVIP
jgi:hypothetical protein